MDGLVDVLPAGALVLEVREGVGAGAGVQIKVGICDAGGDTLVEDGIGKMMLDLEGLE